MDPDDRELERIQRQETMERLEGLLRAVGGPRDEERAREAFRHAHSLTGLCDDREAVIAARRLTRLYSDGRGHVHVPDPKESAEAVALAHALTARIALL